MPAAARFLLVALCLLLALPVLGVLAAWLALDAQSWAGLQHQWRTVLPGYAAQSLLLALGVGAGVMVLGSALAAAVTLFEFPGRRWLEWALLLPLAMPAYVLAYAWTDALQFSGALHTGLRELFGTRSPLWGEVRSLPGAVVLFVLCLYPYVYLLVRAALGERAVRLMEAARLLGAPMRRRVLEVALPMARPAVAAGTALALMETLADYGVGAYFGLTTFSTGIYKAWLVMADPMAAAQLASLLLLLVAVLLTAERRAQRQMRFVARGGPGGMPAAGGPDNGNPEGATSGNPSDARPLALPGAAGWALAAACSLPVLLGFVAPVGWLLHLLVQEARYGEVGLPLARFAQWSWNSFQLAALAALAATALALAVAFALRRNAGAVLRAASRVLALGYAVPGAVVAVGLLLPLAWAQQRWPGLGLGAWFTGTVLGLMLAYLVRFTAVALQSIEAGYARVPLAVDETARMLGSSGRRLFMTLHLPLLQRSVLAAALLVFVDVMKELPATLVLRPFGSDTLAVVAYNLARDERLAEAALPSLAIVAVGLLPVVLLSRALRAPPA